MADETKQCSGYSEVELIMSIRTLTGRESYIVENTKPLSYTMIISHMYTRAEVSLDLGDDFSRLIFDCIKKVGILIYFICW